MKTIAIDCRFASTQSGLGRYTRELVTCLVKTGYGIRYVLLVRSPDESWIPAADHVAVIQADFPHYSLAEQTKLPALLRSAKVDLLFSPHFNIPFFCPVPFVVTLHDLILHRYPNDASFFKKAAYKILVSRAARKAKRIIAISNFVQSEIAEMYGKTIAKKVRVVCEGVSDLYRPASPAEKKRIKQTYGLSYPYFLYVGNAKQHKNVRLLIDAFLQSAQEEHELILVTGGKESEALSPLPPFVRRLENVPDADMPALYSSAEACITASLYEGFCLPVAEALACGCPVIATNRSAIPEVANGHATLLEPTVSAYADAFCNSYAHTASIIIGDWKKAAADTYVVLQDALSL